MTSLPLLIPVILFAVAALLGFLLTLNAWEFRRLVRSRLRQQISDYHVPLGHVALIAPVKGADPELRRNLAALLEQDYADYQVVFVVESEDDPALPVIRKVAADYPHAETRVVIAGQATDSGQKVHNLLAATENLDDKVSGLAFVDADSRPPRHWLRNIGCRLYEPGYGAATAYQWFIPSKSTLPNLMLSSVVASAASLMGRHNHNLISGATWAVRRDVFEACGVRQAWRGTLSDDLVASRVIRSANLHIEFEPNCLCASPGDVSFSQMFEFARRQFLIARFYAPKHWVMTLLSTTAMQVGLWANVFSAIGLAVAGSPSWSWFAMAAMTLFGMGALRAGLRQDAARKRFPEYADRLAAGRYFDILAGPLVGLVAIGAMLSSAVGRQLCWRGNRYRLLRGGAIQSLNPPVGPAAAAATPSSAACPNLAAKAA